jgi:hypothetical protein
VLHEPITECSQFLGSKLFDFALKSFNFGHVIQKFTISAADSPRDTNDDTPRLQRSTMGRNTCTFEDVTRLVPRAGELPRSPLSALRLEHGVMCLCVPPRPRLAHSSDSEAAHASGAEMSTFSPCCEQDQPRRL